MIHIIQSLTGTKPLGLTIFKAFISKGVVKTGKNAFEK